MASTTANPTLDADIARLERLGYELEVLSAGGEIGVVVHDLPLPAGYNRSTTSLLVKTTTLYPASAMDMFWVDAELLLANGACPQSGESIEVQFDRTWRRYSWHRNTTWVPGRDDLIGHVEFCVARLQRPV